MLEKVPKCLKKILAFNLDGKYLMRGSNYEQLCKIFHYWLFENRGFLSGISFLFKLVKGVIDSPYLLMSIPILVPRLRSRSNNIFYIFSDDTNIIDCSSLLRICKEYNSIANNRDIDVFFDSYTSFVSNFGNIYENTE